MNPELIAETRGFLTLKGVPYMADGVNVTYIGKTGLHHIFRARSGWLITVTDLDLALKDAMFTPEPVKFKARMKYHAA